MAGGPAQGPSFYGVNSCLMVFCSGFLLFFNKIAHVSILVPSPTPSAPSL